jgi:hypothetical protein
MDALSWHDREARIIIDIFGDSMRLDEQTDWWPREKLREDVYVQVATDVSSTRRRESARDKRDRQEAWCG